MLTRLGKKTFLIIRDRSNVQRLLIHPKEHLTAMFEDCDAMCLETIRKKSECNDGITFGFHPRRFQQRRVVGNFSFAAKAALTRRLPLFPWHKNVHLFW